MVPFMYGTQAPQYSVGSAYGMYGTQQPAFSVGSANGMYGGAGAGGSEAAAGAAGGGAVMPMLAGLQAIFNMDKENRDRKLASQTQRYSPWTSLRAQPIEAANPVGDVAQGYAGYLGQQQNEEANNLRKQLTKAQIRALDRGDNPYSMQRFSMLMPSMDSGRGLPTGGTWPMGDYNPNYTKG